MCSIYFDKKTNSRAHVFSFAVARPDYFGKGRGGVAPVCHQAGL
jgi:hypothetical protein